MYEPAFTAPLRAEGQDMLTEMAMAQDISRCVSLLGIRAEMLAMRVALLRHLGRQIQLPSQAQPKPPFPTCNA